MHIRLVDPASLSDDVLMEEISQELRAGRVVSMPTDTVYGLVGLATDCAALGCIAALKRRDGALPMPVLVGSETQLRALVSVDLILDAPLRSLMDAFWPGPLTIVLPLKRRVLCDDFFSEGTVGVRIPGDQRIRNLAEALGPLVATSANRHGMPTVESGSEVIDHFGSDGPELGLRLVVSGMAPLARPSSVVEICEGRLHVSREGAISRAALASAFGVGRRGR